MAFSAVYFKRVLHISIGHRAAALTSPRACEKCRFMNLKPKSIKGSKVQKSVLTNHPGHYVC